MRLHTKRVLLLHLTRFQNMILLLDPVFWFMDFEQKKCRHRVFLFKFFPVLNPITISLFLWKKKFRHFRSLVLLSETRWKKKLKAHTHSHSHTVNMIRIDVGVCLMCKNALPWKTTTATTTTMERNAHIAFFESNMRRIAHLSEFAVYRKLLHFK